MMKTSLLGLVLCSLAFAQHPSDPYAIGVTLVTSAGCPVFVGSVLPHSPAERAGIQAGDRVVSVEGTHITSLPQAAKPLSSDQPGTLTAGFLHGELVLHLTSDRKGAPSLITPPA